MYHSGFAYWNWESTEFSNLFIVFFWIFIFAAIPCWPNEHYLRVKALELFWGYLCIYWQIDLGKSIVIFIYLLALAASIICLFFFIQLLRINDYIHYLILLPEKWVAFDILSSCRTLAKLYIILVLSAGGDSSQKTLLYQ